MVNLTRIYTRTGDDGTTTLGDMSRTSKTDPRLSAYADVDETNSSIGVALALGGLSGEVTDVLRGVQNDLFDVGADLCTPVRPDAEHQPLRVTEEYVTGLEGSCDAFNERLDKLRSFILPGGTPGAALLHVARTVARRAERSTWAALQVHGESMNPLTARYLNRLSDLLFILARVANTPAAGGAGDILWEPGGTH
jgi:cob(I)alamin adenosyltransferase